MLCWVWVPDTRGYIAASAVSCEPYGRRGSVLAVATYGIRRVPGASSEAPVYISVCIFGFLTELCYLYGFLLALVLQQVGSMFASWLNSNQLSQRLLTLAS